MTEKEEGNKMTYVCHCGHGFEKYVTKGSILSKLFKFHSDI
jgi:hypothetical protein